MCRNTARKDRSGGSPERRARLLRDTSCAVWEIRRRDLSLRALVVTEPILRLPPRLREECHLKWHRQPTPQPPRLQPTLTPPRKSKPFTKSRRNDTSPYGTIDRRDGMAKPTRMPPNSAPIRRRDIFPVPTRRFVPTVRSRRRSEDSSPVGTTKDRGCPCWKSRMSGCKSVPESGFVLLIRSAIPISRRGRSGV